ncbi:hypothetical protein [Nitrospirillum sp. BR 11163]|uniref:hypothetical protein n=1 Tax=Nitrospirillum sp. BR 11163 TaxID=3104323 RepID=UPI002AFFC7E8|nr:hypothetical protein [Nitrospirillum sp. BR 11163]MEA1675820.1 hypothetical protein [Nitrospirillum sp. BR 11163]
MASKGKPVAARAPLTNEQLERIMADDFIRLKLTDDEKARLREINEMKRQRAEERTTRLKLEQGPLLADLHAVGWPMGSVWDLINMHTRVRYPEAIPVLLRHLMLPYSDRIRDGIARARAVPEPEARAAWPLLVAEYRKAPMGQGIVALGDTSEYRLGAKDGLACALSILVTEATLPDLIELTRDRSLGESRVLLLSALKKRRNKNPLVAQVIAELADDPDLRKEIAAWRKR